MSRLRFVVGAILLLSCTARAQLGSTGPLNGVNGAFLQLFGNNTVFTAKVDAEVLDKSQKEWARLPLTLARVDDKCRLDINMEQVKSRDLPEFAVSSLKQVGMTQVISLIRLDQKATYVIYPGAESYLKLPLEKADAEAAKKGYKTQKTVLGKETVDGHACTKQKFVVEGEGSPALEATVWEASDLKSFPLKIETKDKDNTLVLRMSQVQFAKTDLKRFDLPSGYTEYKDPQEMMLGLMKKIVGSATK